MRPLSRVVLATVLAALAAAAACSRFDPEDSPVGPPDGAANDGASDVQASDVQAVTDAGADATGSLIRTPRSVGTVPLLRAPLRSEGLVADNGELYVGDIGTLDGGRIMKCPLPTCAGGWELPLTDRPYEVLVTRDHVYWSDDGPRGVARAFRDASSPSRDGVAFSGAPVHAFALEGAFLYYATTGVTNINRCEPASGCATTGIVTSGQTDVGALLADEKSIYWSVDGKILTCVIASCTPQLVTATAGTARIAIRDGRLYYGDKSVLASCGLAQPGCADKKMLTGAVGSPRSIAVDECAVYWTDESLDGSVGRCALPSCADGPFTLASEQRAPSALALDRTSVYWAVPSSDGGASGAVRYADK
jgi:hypothetical protein